MGHMKAQLSVATLLVLSIPFFAGEATPPPGVHNFHEVNEHVYRGAQPTREGFKSLAKMGVKTVIDLREERSSAEEKLVKDAGMKYISVPMRGMSAPTDDDIAKVLRTFDDSTSWPVFVHCRRGADRTGTVIACYRITHDHWKNQKALEEARLYGMSFVERAMMHYVMHFQPTPVEAATQVQPAVKTPTIPPPQQQ